MLPGQMNGLVILVAALAGPLILLFRLPVIADLYWAMIAVFYLLAVTLMLSGAQYFTSVGYTGMLALAFVAFSGALNTGLVPRERFRHLLRRLIQAYAVVSVLQLAASLAGLPVPNEISSKGLWSYNSLAVEPSHAARALACSMLAYLLLSRRDGRPPSIGQLWREEKSVLLAFFVSGALTGSTLAVGAMALTVLLALRLHWSVAGVAVLFFFWPLLLLVEIESVKRLTAFLMALPSMDILTISGADHSGAVRLMPLILFLQQMDLSAPSVWFGGGYEAIAFYVRGMMIGVDPDAAMAGFIPGYVMVCGFFGAALFLYAFVGRFLNRKTFPLVLLWILLLATSAWNTQIFWFSLMLIRAVHHFSKAGHAQSGSVRPNRIAA